MGISIQDKSATFPDSFPKFGQIVRPDLLLIGYRGTNSLNDINIAESGVNLNKVGSISYAPNKKGYFRNSTSGAYYKTDVSPIKNTYTIFVVFEASSLDSGGSAYLLGNFATSSEFNSSTPPTNAAPSGRGVYIFRNTDGTRAIRLTRNAWDIPMAAFGNRYVDIPLPYTSGASGLVCAAFSINDMNAVYGMLSNSATLTDVNSNPALTDFSDAKLNTGFTPSQMYIGRNYASDMSSPVNMTATEILYFDDALTKSELEHQYQLTKKLLQARGLDISHWR